MLIQQLVNGLTLGSVYSLIAVGFSLVFSVLEIINFSHGSLLMMAVFISLTLGVHAPWLGVPGILVVTMIAVGVLGMVVDRLVVLPLRLQNAARPLFLLSTLGTAIFLEALAQIIWGAEVQDYPLSLPQGFVQLPGARVSYTEIIIISLSAVLMVGLQAYVRYTRLGRAIRATAQNATAAALMGIDTRMVARLTFAIGSALAAVAGVLMGAHYNFAHPSMGFMPGIKGFVAAVLGGMGSVLGAGLGGVILGMAEVLGGGYISFAYQDAVAFAILILIFLIRPQGILGTRITEKV